MTVSFSFGNYWRFMRLASFRGRNAGSKFKLRRIACLIALYLLFPWFELATRICLLLDDVFFGGYREEEIRRPIFIVGNPRSGTTFLHRLLAKDRQNSTMRTWEILFAPSIVQRKVVWALAALDRRLGGLVHEQLLALKEQWRESNVAHRVALREPEEDEYILLHIWSTLAIWLFSGVLDEAQPYTYFDTAVPRAEKERIMAFYSQCLRRHLHAHGGDHRHYLAKSPAYSAKVDALYTHFPDARIIYLVRNPLNVIPSYISLMNFAWDITEGPAAGYAGRDYVLDMARHWYSYPVERFERAPQDSYVVVKYDDLVGDPEQTVADIYDRLGLDITPAFARVLQEEAEKAQGYRSRHEYSLQQMGLTREQIVAEYRDVFDRFGFDVRGRADEADDQADRHPRPAGKQVGRRAKSRPRQSVGLSAPE